MVCRIVDNPEPVEFKVQCLGAKPKGAVLLPGEELVKKEEDKVEVEVEEVKDDGKKGGKGGKGKGDPKVGKGKGDVKKGGAVP